MTFRNNFVVLGPYIHWSSFHVLKRFAKWNPDSNAKFFGLYDFASDLQPDLCNMSCSESTIR